jgi:hypothetical protein
MNLRTLALSIVISSTASQVGLRRRIRTDTAGLNAAEDGRSNFMALEKEQARMISPMTVAQLDAIEQGKSPKGGKPKQGFSYSTAVDSRESKAHENTNIFAWAAAAVLALAVVIQFIWSQMASH